MSQGNITQKSLISACDRARQAGFEVIEDRDDLLLLDLDSDEQFKIYEHNLAILPIKGIKELERWRSKSGNRHVVIQLPSPLPFVERLLLQAVLGSDPVRGALSYAGHVYGVVGGNVLFKPKQGE